LALTFVEDLLEADAVHGIHPHGDFGQILADCRVLRNKLELVSGYAAQLLLARIGDVPLVLELLSARTEAEKEVATDLIVLVSRHLVRDFLVQLKLALRVFVYLRNGLSVLFGDMRRHLEGVAVSLVVHGPFLGVFVRNGIGLV